VGQEDDTKGLVKVRKKVENLSERLENAKTDAKELKEILKELNSPNGLGEQVDSAGLNAQGDLEDK
jgi:cell division protein FtsL